MKAYVVGYESKEGPENDIEVGWDKEPRWTMSVFKADAERHFLQRKRVHLGEHYCQFSVEALPGGEFSIVCLSHPDLES